MCGAVAPYSDLLGGKLVALLMASPEVQAAYAERYDAAPSLIASSMAGRPIVRGGRLCLLTTSSLFHVASAQYNRLSVPAAALGGQPGQSLSYVELGLTAGFGSSQFSSETTRALEELCGQRREGQRMNRILGEGTNPTMRMVREGLDQLGLPSDVLLQHGSPRRVYGVSLVSNLDEALLGVAEPEALLPGVDPGVGTAALVRWWRARWMDARSASGEVLERVEAHRLDWPVRHGARVALPAAEDAEALTRSGRQAGLYAEPPDPLYRGGVLCVADVVFEERSPDGRALETGALDLAVRDHSAREIGASEARAAQVAIQYRHSHHVGPVEAASSQVGVVDLHLHHVRAAEVTTRDDRLAERAAEEDGSLERARLERRIVEVHSTEVDLGEI